VSLRTTLFQITTEFSCVVVLFFHENGLSFNNKQPRPKSG